MSAKLKFARPFAIAALLAASAMPALAADAIEAAPEPAVPMEEPPLATWGGPYAGISLGYGWGDAEAPAGNEFDTDGFLGAVFAGYNFEFGSVVAGVEGDLGYSGVEGENAGVSVDSGIEGSLRARLGYAFSPDVLPYITAGVAGKNVEVSAGGASDENTMVGWTAGAGVDVKVTENMFVRGEYRYTDFGSDDFTTAGGFNGEVDSKDHRATLGVGFKF